jgi:hypothetical protein
MRLRLRPLAGRGIGVATLAVLIVVFAAAPADAHTISGPRPTNYRGRIVSVTPPAPGVTLRIVDLGARTELSNDTNSDVIVLGADKEPYLRVGPDGVFENLHSASTYVNRSVKGGVIPPGVDTNPKLPPDWRKISNGHVARWHDHAAHWMQPTPPPIVQASPDRFHRINLGHIYFTHDGVTSDAAVALEWVPGPSRAPWFVATAIFAVLGFALAVRRSWSRALAVAIAVLVLSDIVHAIAYEMSRAGSLLTKAGEFFGGAFVSIAIWIVAVPTVIGLWRRRADALYGAIFVGLLIALVGGATDLSALWKSQLPTVGPRALTRLEVALSLGLGAGIAIGALVRILRTERTRRRAVPTGHWISMLVVGLSESEIRRIAAELDVDEVLDAALGELAERLEHGNVVFDGSLVIDVVADDDAGRHTWSITRRDGELAPERGSVAPSAVEIGTSFPVLLQLLAGTLSFDEARQARRVTARGTESDLAALAAALPEQTSPNATNVLPSDPAPAS